MVLIQFPDRATEINRPRAKEFVAITVSAFLLLASVACADVKVEGIYTRVTGKLEKVEANGIRVDAGEAKPVLVGFSPVTDREIVAKGDEDFLIERVPVIVRGHLTEKDTTIADAHVTVMLGPIKARIEPLPLPSDKRHILIAGIISKSSPLEVIATGQILNSYVLDNMDRRSPPRNWAQMKFKVLVQKEGLPHGPVAINLGARIDLIKPGAYVSASIPNNQNVPVAKHIYVRQDELMDIEAFKKLLPGKKGK